MVTVTNNTYSDYCKRTCLEFGIVINQLGGKTYSDHLTSSARFKNKMPLHKSPVPNAITLMAQ